MHTSTKQQAESAPAQFPVLVTIKTGHKVELTYFDGKLEQQPSLHLKVPCPTNCLFILDYETSKSGWTITGTSTVGSSPSLAAMSGPMNLSLMTIDTYSDDGGDYRYFLHFTNPLTKDHFPFDPQETNVRS